MPRLKFLSLFLLLVFSCAAQTNNARMLSGVNPQTGSTYTLQPTDATYFTTFNNAFAVAVTLPSGMNAGYGAGTIFPVKNIGAGTVTISCTGCTITAGTTSASSLMLISGQGADLYGDGVNFVAQTGGGGGGSVTGTANQINASNGVVSFTSPAVFPGYITTTSTLSMIGFTPDNFCGLLVASAQDQFCDWTSPATGVGELVWNSGGTFNRQIFVTKPQNSPAAAGAGYFFNSSIGLWDLAQNFSVSPTGVVNENGTTTTTLSATTVAASTSVTTPQATFNGTAGGADSFVQGGLSQPQATSWTLEANPTEPGAGAIQVMPSAVLGSGGQVGVFQGITGSGATGWTVTCSSCGALTTGNISAGAGGTYTVPPACWITGGGGTGATCSSGSLSAGAVNAPTITNGGQNYTSAATMVFSTQEQTSFTNTITVQSIKVSGTAPTCAFTSGGGTGSPTCTLDTGSTDTAGIMAITTGTTAAGTGTITLTFSATFGTNKPACEYQASDAGAAAWNGLAVMKDKTPSTSSDLFTWTNGTTPTALSNTSTYWINYQCIAK